MLAYVFWHAPAQSTEVEAYEQALEGFHRSLARSRPVGLRGSASFRLAELPWLMTVGTSTSATGAGAPDGAGSASAPGGYEDWYLLDDYAALGVLGQAAVGRGHRSAHDRAAHRTGHGTAGLYAHVEGACDAPALAALALAVWVTRPLGQAVPGLAEMLADGLGPAEASLWRRELTLGPAPEVCLMCDEPPMGVSPTRLPHGWSARALARAPVWSG